MADCNDYSPGPIQGKERPVCKNYIMQPLESAGGCKHPGHFMCVFWLENLQKKAAKNRPSGITTEDILRTFPGSTVVGERIIASAA